MFCERLLSIAQPEEEENDNPPAKAADKKQSFPREQFFYKLIEFIEGGDKETIKGDGYIVKWLLFCIAKMFKYVKKEKGEDESKAKERLIVINLYIFIYIETFG